MKLQQFYITSALGALALVLVIVSITLNKSNQSSNFALQQKQQTFNAAQSEVQIAQNLLSRILTVLQNEQIDPSIREIFKDVLLKNKELLAQNGITINETPQDGAPAPAPTPAPTPQPAAPAPTPSPESIQ